MESIAVLKPSHWLELIKLPVKVFTRAEWLHQLQEIDSTFQGNTLYWHAVMLSTYRCL